MINNSGTYDSSTPASQADGTIAGFQIALKTHPEMLSDPAIQAAMHDPVALQAAMSLWLKTHDPSYDPNNLYKIQNGATTPNSGSWFSDHLPLITTLMGAGLVTPAVFAALAGGGAAGGAAAGGSALADLGPSTTANIAATGAAGAAPAGIAAGGGAAAGAAGGAAAASTPWWQTAIKAGAPLAATALTRGVGGDTTSALDPAMQANIKSLLDLSMRRAQESAPVHQAAMALALHLAPTYARANGLPPSPLTTTNPTTPPTSSPATSAAFDALLHGRSGGY